MRLNGNLVLNAGGLSQIENAVIERVTSIPAFSAAEKGRFVFLTTDGKVYYNTGAAWSALATGGNAAALQTEVDALEASLGALIAATGEFNAAGATLTNVTGATSITDIISQLDAAISTAKAQITAEVSRATAAEGVLTTDLATEVSRAQAAEADLAADLAAEVTRATGAEGTLTTNLAAEVTRATTAEAGLAADIAAETTRATAAEATLTSNLNAEVTRATTAEAQETANRIAADTAAAAAASDQLATETNARLAGDAAATTRMNGIQAELDTTQAGAGLNVDGTFSAPGNTTYLADATSLKNADVLLDKAIKDEVDRATGAEAGLASALANEAQLRADGDAALQSTIESWVQTQIALDNTTDEARVAAEAALRIAKDDALQAELDQTQASIGLGTDGKVIPVTGTNYLDGISTVFAGAFVLDTQIKAVADALATETDDRTQADATFQANLDAEKAARELKDNNLQAELNTTQAGAGLETDGTYVAPTGSNYLNAAVSLKDADYILDAAVKVNADAIVSLGSSSSAAIAAEQARAVAAEGVLQANISAETTRAQGAEATLTANLASEVSRAQAAEDTLTTNLAAEVTRATAAESVLTTDVAAINAKISKLYFLYDGAAATSHVVAHGLNQKYCNVTVVDAGTDEVIIPQSIVFDSANGLTVTLNAALAIKVVVMGAGF